jgi:hypothetical protein
MRDIPCFAYEAMLASDLSIVDLRGRTAPAAEAFGADGGLPGIPDSSVAQELKPQGHHSDVSSLWGSSPSSVNTNFISKLSIDAEFRFLLTQMSLSGKAHLDLQSSRDNFPPRNFLIS